MNLNALWRKVAIIFSIMHIDELILYHMIFMNIDEQVHIKQEQH